MTFTGAIIDLSFDLEKAFGSWEMSDDITLLDIATSTSIACGCHTGDASVMMKTREAAAVHGIHVDAHVTYRGLAGFG